MQNVRRIVGMCLLLFLVSQILFLVNIQFPTGHNFDEFHYVPSAKQFLELRENQNWEHPPLGKLMIAGGLSIFGDRPLGWRYMSTFFGSLTLVGMYLWGLALFRNRQTAFLVAVLTVSNQLLYVQARIGMLDTFMFAFIVWGLAAFTAAWNTSLSPKKIFGLTAFSGLMFGLATACKWTALVPWFTCIVMVGVVRLLQGWKTQFSDSAEDDWFSPELFRGLTMRHWLLCFLLIPLFAYFSTFLPFLFVHRAQGGTYGLWDLVLMQPKMWEGQQRVTTAHPYMSHWLTWPLMKRPIWYAFDREGDWVRGVLMLGNPVLMWGGLLAVLASAWTWIAQRSRTGFFITVFYVAFVFCWAAIPRKVAFYYYYYPAGMTLSLAVAFVFDHWEKGELFPVQWARWLFVSIVVGVFVYFFPILAALRIPADSFRNWMWLQSWI